MSFIIYDGVQLGLIQTRSYQQSAITLGQDQAGTRHTLSVLATVARTTLGLTGGPDAVMPIGPPGPGANGAAALIRFRDQMMTPRKAFRFVVGNQTFANIVAVARPGVPLAADALDIENGPKPLACNILGFNSVGSVVVEYTIQWAMPNPCEDVNDTMAVLAHAWKGEDEISEDFFLTRVYTGIIHFNAMIVGPGSGNAGIHPDRLRRILFPPRTPGTHRRSVQVKNLEDGYTMAYRIVDAQPNAFVNSEDVTRIEATQSLIHTTPSSQETLAARAEWWNAWAGGAVRIAGQEGGLYGDTDPDRKDRRGLVQLNMQRAGTIGGGIAGGVFAAGAALYNGIPLAVHAFEAIAYGTPRANFHILARAARVVCLFRLMKGTMIGGQGLNDPDSWIGNVFGGRAEQFDSSDPKSSTIRMTVTTRPVVMPSDQTGALWDKGFNKMPTIIGQVVNGMAGMQNEEIKSLPPNSVPIPLDIRQLLYGGAIQGAPGNWGWVSSAFAPDLMSNRDAGIRNDALYPTQADGTAMQLMLIRALQDPCAYTPRFGVQFSNTAPLVNNP